jgi:hypothetical protein
VRGESVAGNVVERVRPRPPGRGSVARRFGGRGAAADSRSRPDPGDSGSDARLVRAGDRLIWFVKWAAVDGAGVRPAASGLDANQYERGRWSHRPGRSSGAHPLQSAKRSTCAGRGALSSEAG